MVRPTGMLCALCALLAGRALGAANASDAATYGTMASTLLEFENALLTPGVVPAELLSLGGALQVSYGNYSAELGSYLPLANASATSAPNGSSDAQQFLSQHPALSLNYTPAVTEQQLFWSQLFTVLTLDAGYPIANATQAQQAAAHNATLQYLSNNNTVVNGALMNFTAAVMPWAAPVVPAGSGPRRLVQLVFAQGDEFAPLPAANVSMGAGNFSVADYVAQTKLGKIVAASYFIVENGTALANGAPAVQPTQPVPEASVAAKATAISASIIAEGTRGAQLKAVNAAAPANPAAKAAAAVAAVAVAAAVALLA